MTYCSQIMHEKEEKIKALETEIQQLKDKIQDRQEIIDLFQEANQALLNTNEKLQEQVEAAKTWVNNYCLGCSRFKGEQCTLKKPSSCIIKQLREVLGE